MKNIICLVIDSLGMSFLEQMPNRERMFLQKTAENGFLFSDVYSQGPYTEAAVMGLQCGQRTLDYNGYMHRLADTPLTIFEAFQEHGYRTFCNTIQPHMYQKSLIRGVSDYFYNVPPDFRALYVYRLSYFSRFFNPTLRSFDQPLMQTEVQSLFKDYFESAIVFDNSVLSGDPSASLVQENLDIQQIKHNLSILVNERALFEQNEREYVANFFLSDHKKHALFINPVPRQDHKITSILNKDRIERAIKPILKLESKVYRKTNVKNRFDRTGLFQALKRLLKSPNRSSFREWLKASYYNLSGKFYLGAKEWKRGGFDKMKDAPSLRAHLEHFLKWKRTCQSPYFAYIHVDDIHGNSTWISYDAKEPSIAEKEAESARSFFSSIKTKRAGNVNYLAGINYVDNVIRYFFEELEKTGELENTVVVITADHGYSLFQKPIRSNPINTFHPEAYRVPVIIFGGPKGTCNLPRQTFSIPNTLLSLAGLPEDVRFYGRSLFEHEIDIVTQEFMGGGCPDMNRRPLLLCARNAFFSLSVQKKLTDETPLLPSDIVFLYDLVQDPNEQRNICKDFSFANPCLNLLFKTLERRYEEIKKSWSYE